MMENLLSVENAILITGPTASGKSALAVELAKRCGGAVVNADSMQVYDTLRVLTARPSEWEMQGVSHHLYGHVPAGVAYSTGAWLRDVSTLLPALKAAGQLPVFVGGTGLYFKALTGGLSDMPAIPEALREKLRTRLLEEGPERLYSELAAIDPIVSASLNRQDGQRIVRALEVIQATGRSIADFQGRSGPVLIDAEKARKIVVLPDRAVLHARINGRFEKMLQQGAEDEVRALLSLGLPAEAPVMKAIGVSQIAAMLKGEMTREEVLEKGAATTRQYAKRQMTWFRNQMDESWERLPL
ncbi:tRNA (adenosine(37)-N6)-dimethylallyltransferase MiaA [Rhizobium sp. MC63]|uniref:tRNA (Adenosine(37)-N6)-dimethylallyltransferase MiaA n=1 Tax=Rhizobium mulingense TaxID=3031128 RepID=A0ACC6MTH2_9HYPH|nr:MULTISPECIES: tRNA (adenosine(37)-N6)-dimethylallyltransferase MiaA [unclassified Rhizobium]MDF0697007.1 tRNA (adenosine(37)-N6)-dimethylallyltransferase MiaA [Rhizobium sp. MC63]MEA3516673.1 tRNA (adenosine(37)-N6)-dimethylallyltransferase MiaA [Rhizobium sp. MJ31]